MRLILPASLILIGGISLAVVAADPPGDEPAPTLEQLKERLEKLEDRVGALEAERPRRFAPVPAPGPRLRPRPPRQGDMQPVPPGYAPPRQQPSEERVPESWRRFEFNGQDYYIIPVDDVSSDAAAKH